MMDKCPQCGFTPELKTEGPRPWMEHHADKRYHVKGCACRHCFARDAARIAKADKRKLDKALRL